jgi:sphingolipid delta-4 desaturase
MPEPTPLHEVAFAKPATSPHESSSTPDARTLSKNELHLGEWKRSVAWQDEDFARDNLNQPHIRRRRAILAKYPMIRRLYQPDIMTMWVIFFAVASNLTLAWMFGKTEGFWSWILMAVTAFAIGASIDDLLAICVHECCHGLVTTNSLTNKLLALLCNVGTPVPIAMGFRRYHSDHHVYQGSASKDPDMPLPWELKLIKGNFIHKLLWLTVYPIMYAVRAISRGKTVTKWEAINTVFTITCDLVFFFAFGVRGCVYLTLSFLYGYTFHPVAAHFLQEHYTFASGQETYNYYGWANTPFLNIGFHNEHHDFPAVPARLLPLLTKIAPEYYQPLLAHRSWRKVLWDFLTDSNIGPVSRCARD